ncbi:MAG TPA: hypothetical protein VHF45_06390 [Thermoleophilaceae bacterium]|nr:hypothetical protein [Thermoleophilaceae bacterium]
MADGQVAGNGRSTAERVADWEEAPGVVEGALEIELSPHDCDIEFWVQSVAQGTLKGLVHGRKPDSTVPDFLRQDGPLRQTLIEECSFRSISEEYATKACGLTSAAGQNTMQVEFFATQCLDEARHSYTFRHHLVDLGVPEDQLAATVEAAARENADRILKPTWDWGVKAYKSDFASGVVIITVLLEGVLAPTTELAERKWKAISPATADIERGACVDEVRHLAVGSWFIKDHLERNPDDKPRILELIMEGREFWGSLPVPELIAQRETLFQQGIEELGDLIGDAEIVEGRRLVDTTVEERLGMALEWSQEVQDARLRYMGLEDAIPQAAADVAR